jgi:hypothetical protein
MGLSSVMAARGSEAMRPVQIDHVLGVVSMIWYVSVRSPVIRSSANGGRITRPTFLAQNHSESIHDHGSHEAPISHRSRSRRAIDRKHLRIDRKTAPESDLSHLHFAWCQAQCRASTVVQVQSQLHAHTNASPNVAKTRAISSCARFAHRHDT